MKKLFTAVLIVSMLAGCGTKRIVRADELVARYMAGDHENYQCTGMINAKVSMSAGILSFDIPVDVTSLSKVRKGKTAHHISCTYAFFAKSGEMSADLMTERKDDHTDVRILYGDDEITLTTDLVSLVDKIDAKTFEEAEISYNASSDQYEVKTTLQGIVRDYSRIENLLNRFFKEDGIFDFTVEQITSLIESSKDAEVMMIFDADTLDLLEVKSDRIICSLLLDEEGSSEIEIDGSLRFTFERFGDILEEETEGK